jgi:hypothetical protein
MRDDLSIGAAGQLDGTTGALGENMWDEDDDFVPSFYEDTMDRMRDLVGSFPVNIVLAASAAGLSIGVFLTNYQ